MSDTIQPASASPPQRPATAAPEVQAPAVKVEPAVAATATAQQALAEQKAPVVQLAQPAPSPEQKRKDLSEAIQHLNDQVRKSNYNLNFSVDDSTSQVVVQVRNTHSGDVIRQIPSETVLRVAHNLDAVKGLLSDEAV
jgi:flagellar protein FlaG